ncbi:MAG TPA: 1-aminocyclopropane-1-carboxylate deaminase/D-cysteine desulfhydrase, partial [Roseivirga sp.]
GQVLGFSALKGDFLKAEVRQLLTDANVKEVTNWSIITDYHFGGYAKTTHELIDFIRTIESEYSSPLEPIYTGKMLFGVLDLIDKNHFLKGSKILLIHTGGLQGRAGFNL